MIDFLKKKKVLKKTWTIKKRVLESIMEFSKHYYPREFAAFLAGASFVIDDIYIIPATKNYSRAAFIKPNLAPMTLKVIGSVHSHPSGNGSPSYADVSFFRGKQINIIFYYPYDLSCYKVYNKKGEAITIDVV